jgi:putative cardiolipin synthase
VNEQTLTGSVATVSLPEELLGRFAAEAAAAHPAESGFALLEDGRDALLMRLALAGLATRTLNVQYYLWHDDATGRLLARCMLDAADRGVRVRMLIDDIHLAGRDTGLATLDSHRNIEVRIFNPFRARIWPSWSRLLEAIREGNRLNHRMHNKTFVADDCLAIVGGRNIGDEYFAASEQANFRDLDLLTLGPVVSEIDGSFEAFWQSELAVPVRKLTVFRPTKRFVRRWFRRLRRFRLHKASLKGYSHLTRADLAAQLESLRSRLHCGHARAVYDLPEKVGGEAPPRMAQAMLALLQEIDHDLLIETAYFVPDAQSLAVLRSLREKGVTVTVLTNSLASNDVIAAHAGYSASRPSLLQIGVRLFEVRSRAARREATAVGTRVGSRASLHSKAAVLDRDTVFVGTLNFDPRSLYINTEIGLIVKSTGLAREMATAIERAFAAETSFEVVLEGEGRRAYLRWRAEGLEELRREPEAGFLRRCLAWIYQRLPVIHRWL